MARGSLPPYTFPCNRCGEPITTTARASQSGIRCHADTCRHPNTVPAARPRTEAEARARTAAATAGRGNGLAEAWAAEAPYVPAWQKISGPAGPDCPQCGQPRQWTGAHTGLICLDRSHERPIWSVSPGAKARTAEHLAAIDKSAARRSAQLADPEAERLAAETFAAERAELLDDLDGLADALDVGGFPRGDAEYEPARRAGIRYAGTARLYAERARKAETLDQLRRVDDDAGRFAASVEGWLDRIADLRDSLEGPPGRVIPGELTYDDDDQDDDAEPEHQSITGTYPGRAGLPAAGPRPYALPSGFMLAPPYVGACERCRAPEVQRRIGARWPAAIASIEAPGMVPAPVKVCADHLAAAQARYGPALHVSRFDDFWSRHDRAVAAEARAEAGRQLAERQPHAQLYQPGRSAP